MLAPSSYSASTLGVALLAVAIAALAVPVGAALRKKMRVSEGLKPIPGPKGWPLLGMLPEILKHAPRVHEFYVRLSLSRSSRDSRCKPTDSCLRMYQESLLLQYGGRAKFPWSILADNSVWVRL